jgi:nucleoid-associated protein EbfC
MLKGLGQLGDMAKIMKQAKEMQGQMADMQERLGDIEVVGAAGGLVKVRATAKGEVTSVSLSAALMTAENLEVAEDLILAAIKDAQAKAAEAAQVEMARITDSLGLPAGMKLPF